MRWKKQLEISGKDTWELFRVQMYAIRESWGAVIVLLGLVILPSFYAWFNIAASWDPYQLTGNLKVAVTNNDHDVRVKAFDVNVGKQIEEKLKGNRQFDWQFVDEKTAIEGVHSGTYYAAIVIPETFSKDITSFLTEHIEKPTIDYYVNEKINAISPKVTDTGMNALQREVNETFVQALSEVVLNGLKFFDEKYEAYRPSLLKILDAMDLAGKDINYFIEDLNDVKTLVDQIDAFTQKAQQTLPNLNQSIKDAQDLTLQAQNSLQKGKESLNLVNRIIDQEMNVLPVQMDAVRGDLNRLFQSSGSNASILSDRLNDQSENLHAMARQVHQIRRNMDRFNDLLPVPSTVLRQFSNGLADLEAKLNEGVRTFQQLSEDLAAGKQDVAAIRTQVQETIDGLRSVVSSVVQEYNTNVNPEVNKLMDELVRGLDGTYRLLSDTSALLPQVDQLLGTASQMTPANKRNLERMQTTLSHLKDGLEGTNKDIRTLTEDDKIREVLDFIKKDIKKESDFLSHPVQINKREIFKIPNYGSAMAPFYTTLALWVGVLLLVSIIHPVNIKGLQYNKNARMSEMFISRLALFLCLASAQALIVSLGNLFLLKVHCMHPIGFVLYSILVSQIFAVFVFSLIFAFSDIGKAMAIIVLVLQIAAGGGTYPVEMTPFFFQLIHPLLPFTYAIGGMRELMGGIYWPALQKQMLVLLTIPINSVLVVLIFGPKLRRLIHKFERSMHRSGLNS